MKLKLIMTACLISGPMLAFSQGHGIETKNLDTDVNPREDFYRYACGGWMKNNPLPAEYSRFGLFDLLRDNAREQLKSLITTLSETPEAKITGTNAQKVSDIYTLAMDSTRLNTEGATPLLPVLNRINQMNKEDLAEISAWMTNRGSGAFFGVGVGTDPGNADMNILHIGEAGLGLGDRDYYLEKNETNDKIMDAYQNYVKTIMELCGYSPEDAQRVWDNVIAIETEISKHKRTREERRNPQLRYNMQSIDEIKNNYKNFDWTAYFSKIGINPVKANVSNPKFMEFIDSYIPTLTPQQIKDYLAFSEATDASGVLGDKFFEANFEMFDKVMSGKEAPEPRWKRAMALPNSMFGEAVGELYVEKYFPAENKEYMKNLVENLRVALGQHIDALTWMSEETKKRAHEKLNTFTVKIGYPDKWKDYSEIQIDPSKSLYENVAKASEWFVADNFSKMDKPVDKDEWLMTPQTVNAYYNPTTNEICFPAAILQPPYFDPAADDALNYGAIGVVIGHEMTHGFDDQGRQFDANGNLNNWWAEEDATKFTALADKLVAQFDAVEVAPGVNANGRFTLGENIADQGGLRVALTAYLNSRDGKQADDIDGFSPLQRFYLAYANVWAGNIRPEEILVRTKTDPHSLGENRVNVSLRNIEPFFNAFGIKEGDKMWRPVEDRVIIW